MNLQNTLVLAAQRLRLAAAMYDRMLAARLGDAGDVAADLKQLASEARQSADELRGAAAAQDRRRR